MKIKGTTYTSPYRNIFSAINGLRKCLANGNNGILIKAYNEECEFPICMEEKKASKNFRNYTFNIGYLSTAKEINASYANDFEKYLSLNYKSCYGTPEAMKTYYKTGKVSKDNFKGIGRSHLVKVTDLVKYYESIGDFGYAEIFKKQYITGEEANNRHFYDFFKPIEVSEREPLKFNKKLWVIQLLDKTKPVKVPFAVKVLNVLAYPLKFVPQKSVLRMPEYTLYTFSIGAITNGFNVQFHIPKKFSFK